MDFKIFFAHEFLTVSKSVTEIDCPVPQVFERSSKSELDSFQYGDVVTYTCDNGYSVVGSDVTSSILYESECNAYGNWTVVEELCRKNHSNLEIFLFMATQIISLQSISINTILFISRMELQRATGCLSSQQRRLLGRADRFQRC